MFCSRPAKIFLLLSLESLVDWSANIPIQVVARGASGVQRVTQVTAYSTGK